MKILSKTVVVLMGLTSLVAQAELAGTQSPAANGTNYAIVGGTNYVSDPSLTNPGHPGNVGSPGIMVHKMSPNPNDRKYVSLSGLDWAVWNDSNDVNHIDRNTFGIPARHKDKIGSMDFIKVSKAWFASDPDVYFGEWSDTGSLNAADRQVWYVGKDKTVNMPNGGIVNYAVKGLRQYQHNGILTGTLTANFATSKLYGNVGDINFGNAGNTSVNINATDASFAGGVNVGAVQGDAQGHFFGASAQSIAGTATFTNRNLDTAFGGKKQ